MHSWWRLIDESFTTLTITHTILVSTSIYTLQYTAHTWWLLKTSFAQIFVTFNNIVQGIIIYITCRGFLMHLSNLCLYFKYISFNCNVINVLIIRSLCFLTLSWPGAAVTCGFNPSGINKVQSHFNYITKIYS